MDKRRSGARKHVDLKPIQQRQPKTKMCVKSSSKYQKEKEQLAQTLCDPTCVWYVGADNRDVALSKGKMSWKNKRCTAKNLGITGKRAKTIDNILETSRQNKVSFNPKKVKNKSL